MTKHLPTLSGLNHLEMKQKMLTQHLLTDYDGEPTTDTNKGPSGQSLRRPQSCSRSLAITIGFLVLSSLGNIVLLNENYRLKHIPDLGRSRFSNWDALLDEWNTANSRVGGLGYNYPVEYQSHSDYSSNNSTISEEHWEAIDTSPIVVALSDDYAREHSLQISVRFPWDDNKGIYHVKAFHHLHCLVSSNSQPRSLVSMLWINTVARRTCARPTMTCSKVTRPWCLRPMSITA